MAKNPTTGKPPYHCDAEHIENAEMVREHSPRERKTIDLIKIRPGLFLNVHQIVSVRELPQADSDTYAIVQLSNGDKLHLTASEFTLVCGEEPHQPENLSRTALMKKWNAS